MLAALLVEGVRSLQPHVPLSSPLLRRGAGPHGSLPHPSHPVPLGSIKHLCMVITLYGGCYVGAKGSTVCGLWCVLLDLSVCVAPSSALIAWGATKSEVGVAPWILSLCIPESACVYNQSGAVFVASTARGGEMAESLKLPASV